MKAESKPRKQVYSRKAPCLKKQIFRISICQGRVKIEHIMCKKEKKHVSVVSISRRWLMIFTFLIQLYTLEEK